MLFFKQFLFTGEQQFSRLARIFNIFVLVETASHQASVETVMVSANMEIFFI